MKSLILLVFLTANLCIGQSNRYNTYRYNAFVAQNGSTNQTIRYEIKGSPYEQDDYVVGSTSIFNKKGFDAPMRYNAAKDVIEFIDEDKKIKEVLRRPYIKVTIGEKTYQVLAYLENETKTFGYFNVLNRGETQLLFKPKKQIKVGTQKFQGKIQAQYTDASLYFIQKKGGTSEMVRLSKADLISHLSDKKIALSKFITDYDLNLKRETDAIRLIEYYNTLIYDPSLEKKAQS